MSNKKVPKQITEGMNIQGDWYKRAKEMTVEELPNFIKELLTDYVHDYGTICHALAAGAIGAAWAMNKEHQGGITGFQAGGVMWDFIRHWYFDDNKIGLKLINYDNLLYPQYKESYAKTISKEVWDKLKQEAQRNLDEKERQHQEYLDNKVKYLADLKLFIDKHPEYLLNPKNYERIFFGTQAEYDAQRMKEEAGFEFAPVEPAFTFSADVIKHWREIVSGKVPFGFKVLER